MLVRCSVILAVLLVGCDVPLLHDVKVIEPSNEGCAPAAPGTVTAAPYADLVQLGWSTASDDASEGFRIERKAASASTWVEIVSVGATERAFSDYGAPLDAQLSYRVRSFRTQGTQDCPSVPSAEANVLTYPAPLTAGVATPTAPEAVQLSWTDLNTSTTTVRITRRAPSESQGTLVAEVVATHETYDDATIAANTLYVYELAAVNASGASVLLVIQGRGALAPNLMWDATVLSGNPLPMSASCELTLAGSASFDALTSASFASGSASLDGAAATATATGVQGAITDFSDHAFNATWQVTDSLGSTAQATLSLALTTVDTTRTAARLPQLASEARSEGLQAMQPGCAECTGQAGSVSAGAAHTCAVNPAGEVECWGNNTVYQLGGSDDDAFAVPQPACDSQAPGAARYCEEALTGVTSVSHGGYHGCAVLQDGTARCFGYNADGQLGDGTQSSRSTPMPVCASGSGPTCVALAGVTQVAAGRAHSCAIAEETVYCWGDNEEGQLGVSIAEVPSTPHPTRACFSGSDLKGDCEELTGAHEIVVGDDFTCATLDSGFYCWGNNYYGQLGNRSPDEAVHPANVCGGMTGSPCNASLTTLDGKVAGGYYNSCAVLPDGKVACWGYGYSGRLGNNSGASSVYPTHVCADNNPVCTPLAGVVQVAVGDDHSCAVGSNGAVYCWGEGGSGQLGRGSDSEDESGFAAPVCVSGSGASCTPLSGATAVAVGDGQSCAVVGGQVYCWGENYVGQLGRDTTQSVGRGLAAPVCDVNAVGGCAGNPLINVVEIAVGAEFACARQSSGAVVCWGDNGDEQLGDACLEDECSVPVDMGLSNIDQVVVGSAFACARDGDTAVCWGNNSSGQLGGNIAASTRATAEPICALGSGPGPGCSVLTNIRSLAAAGSHACAVRDDNTLVCWGYNYYGQLGHGGFSSTLLPQSVCESGTGIACPPQTGVATVSALLYGTCFTRTSGEVACFGNNYEQQLAIGPADEGNDRPTPVCSTGFGRTCTALANPTLPSAGYGTACAKSGSSLYCWGSNYYGQVGDNSSSARWVATLVSGLSGVTSVSNGESYTCAVHGENVSCWGSQSQSGPSSLVPVQVAGLSGVTHVAAAEDHSCARKSDGSVLCWGYNGYGQLGDGTFDSHAVPALAQLSGVSTIAAGDSTSCAVTSDARLLCWGDHSYGQSGAGPASTEGSAVRVCRRGTGVSCEPLANSTLVASGPGHSCAIVGESHAVYCWGSNEVYELGDAPNWRHGQALPICRTGAPVSDGNGGYVCEDAAFDNVVALATGGDWYYDWLDIYATGHTCALDAAGAVWCWGANDYGQLGNGLSGSNQYEPNPVQVTCGGAAGAGCTQAGAPLGNVVALSAGGRHNCALARDGQITCWGDNAQGQLGRGNQVGSPTPVSVDLGGATAVAITTNAQHSCALLSDSTVLCWGDGVHGQLGDGNRSGDGETPLLRLSPTPVCISGSGASCTKLSSVIAIAAGQLNTCALLQNGEARCWGLGDSGQNGTGNLGEWSDGIGWYLGLARPQTVCAPDSANACDDDYSCSTALGGLVSISGGSEHMCGLTENGHTVCWGNNSSGQRGDGVGNFDYHCTATSACESGAGTCQGTAPLTVAVQSCQVATVIHPLE